MSPSASASLHAASMASGSLSSQRPLSISGNRPSARDSRAARKGSKLPTPSRLCQGLGNGGHEWSLWVHGLGLLSADHEREDALWRVFSDPEA